jgi:hypothetical protein
MVEEEIDAIFIKVAAMGRFGAFNYSVYPRKPVSILIPMGISIGLLPKHLGKTLAEMRREMLKLVNSLIPDGRAHSTYL